MEANSQPIAPPPMTTADAGSRLEVEHLVGGHHELAVHLEAGDGARHRPDARMTCLPTSSVPSSTGTT